jgi:hypothetical protein
LAGHSSATQNNDYFRFPFHFGFTGPQPVITPEGFFGKGQQNAKQKENSDSRSKIPEYPQKNNTFGFETFHAWIFVAKCTIYPVYRDFEFEKLIP